MTNGIRGNATLRVLPYENPLFGKATLNPGLRSDAAQIEAIAQGIASGAISPSEEELSAFIDEHPAAAPFVQQALGVRRQRSELGRFFSPGGVETRQQEGPVRPGEELGTYEAVTPPRADFEGAVTESLSRGDIAGAKQLMMLQGDPQASSRYKFGQVTNKGTLVALDTQTNKVVEFPNPEGTTIDRPMFSFKQVSPEGEETQTFGPRGSFLGDGTRTVKTSQSQTEKAAFEQRAARGIIARARDLTSKLWTAKNDIRSRYGQAADLYIKQFTQSDPRVAQYDSLREALMAPLIRALGEKGTLAEGDVGRARNLWPKFTDSKEVAEGKLNQVEAIWDGVLTGRFDSLDSAITGTSKGNDKKGNGGKTTRPQQVPTGGGNVVDFSALPSRGR